MSEFASHAIEAVQTAAGLCRAVQEQLVTADTVTKKDRSPVTVADYGVQALIIGALARAFPDIPVVGEEDSAALRSNENAEVRAKVVEHVRRLDDSLDEAAILDAIDLGGHGGGDKGRFWTLDPIDGTKGFLRGDQYAIALALIEDGQVVLGVLGCPNLPVQADEPHGSRGCLFSAVKGEPAMMKPLKGGAAVPIKVTGIANPAAATFCESVEKAHTQQDDSAKVAEILGVTRPPFRIDSQCKYAAIARGDSSIYLRLPTRADYQEKIWDHAAGWMVVTQAGGTVTDIRGKSLDFSKGRTLNQNSGVVATNGKLHTAVINAIGEVIPDKTLSE